MSDIGLDDIRAGRPGCPSDFDLDRLDAGDLAGERAAALFEHIDGCDVCPARMELRASRFDIAPGVDPRRIMAAVRRRVDEEEASSIPARARAAWLKWMGALVVIGGAAAALVFALGRPATVTPDPSVPVVRTKGDPKLDLHRQVGAGSEQLDPGAAVAPGTALKFVVTLPAPGRVQIVGQDASGALYTAWPLGGQDPERAAGRQALPGAVALDDALGPETFHLVFCASGTEIECTLADDALACPDGCRVASTGLVKR